MEVLGTQLLNNSPNNKHMSLAGLITINLPSGSLDFGADTEILYNHAGSTSGNPNLTYLYGAPNPTVVIGGALTGNTGILQLGGATGLGKVIASGVLQLQTVTVEATGAITTPAEITTTAVATGSNPSIYIASTNPQLGFNNSSNTVNLRRWNMGAFNGGTFQITSIGDNGNLQGVAYLINRSTNAITGHTFTIGTTPAVVIDANAGLNVLGTLSSTANVNPASITNSGVAIGGGPSYGVINFFDSTKPADNRTWDIIDFQGSLRIRAKNDVGNNVREAINIAGGYATDITSVTINSGVGTTYFTSTVTTPVSPNVIIYSGGPSGNTPILMFNSQNGANTDRKKWYLDGQNGNFFSLNISNDAGTATQIAYQAYRGLNVVGGHNWYVGAGIAVMSLAGGGLTLSSTAVTAGEASALIDMQSTTQGFLPPRMTTQQRQAIANPAQGLIVWDTTLAAWVGRGAGGWFRFSTVTEPDI